jgi:uncharacterized RmlC-like cupin family protein
MEFFGESPQGPNFRAQSRLLAPRGLYRGNREGLLGQKGYFPKYLRERGAYNRTLIQVTILTRMIKIPKEISGFFEQIHFQNYPQIVIPQSFNDDRGTITNISDGILGDVAIIESVKNSVRANHVHKSDWHLSFCVTGSLIYSFEDSNRNVSSMKISKGELFFTPEAVPHRMDFLEDTTLVVVSKNSRLQEKYEEDTQKHFLEPQRKQ